MDLGLNYLLRLQSLTQDVTSYNKLYKGVWPKGLDGSPLTGMEDVDY